MKVLLVLFVAVAALAFPMVAAAADPSGTDSYGQTYAQAEAAENAPAQDLGGSDLAITPSQADASASLGESVETASGLTLEQATGVSPIPPGTLMKLATSNGVSVTTLSSTPTCKYGNYSYQWGYWPEEQVIHDWTHRCWTGSVITYRSTQVTQKTTGCNADGTQVIKQGGGTGQGFVKWFDIGQFDCPFVIWVITDHHTRTLGMEVTGGGGYFAYTHS